MNRKDYKNALCADAARYGCKPGIRVYIKSNGFKLTSHYRKVKYYSSKKFLLPLALMERIYYHHLCVKYGCDIPSSATIGKGFAIIHTVGVVINSKAVLGENVSIKSGAVIGKTEKGVPVIGNNVEIGVHALLLGNITVGDGAKIGAGAIVTHDVPENAVVTNDAAIVRRIINE